jgi:hypothetical protein
MSEAPAGGLSAVELEVVRHALAGVAEQMGVALRRAAYSPNIKERVDCSTGLFDHHGRVLAQSQRLPLHMGSLLGSVQHIHGRFGEHEELAIETDDRERLHRRLDGGAPRDVRCPRHGCAARPVAAPGHST